MAEKIVQTAGRDTLGEFAPDFAHFNDDILFGENWNNTGIDLKTRSIKARIKNYKKTLKCSKYIWFDGLKIKEMV